MKVKVWVVQKRTDDEPGLSGTTVSFVFDIIYGVYRTRKEAMDAALHEPGFGNSGIFDVTEQELELPDSPQSEVVRGEGEE